jgi:hypothetical protein
MSLKAMQEKPVVEILVEGELSPFEHEALYRLFRKKFKLEHPRYMDLPDEDLTTRVNITFHHPYTNELFANLLQEDWRELKEILKNIRHRRGGAGAAFNITFREGKKQLVFKTGRLEENEVKSAIEQIGYLTSIVRQMTRPETMKHSLDLVECTFDPATDRWHEFKGANNSDRTAWRFDETRFQWTRP